MCVTCGCGTTTHHDAPAPAEDAALRTIRLEAAVLGANDLVAARNRAHFAAHGVTALNLVSSPGSGKTSLLVATIAALRRRAPEVPIAVIEGDQQTSNDAERIRATGVPAIQVNTGKGCHLDATMVERAFARLPMHAAAHREAGPGRTDGDGPSPAGALLFIENVGNLVCPASWDLGEAAKVVVLSVTEGDDKPAKYPDMFAAASLMLVNKTDLLPWVEFDVERCIELARRTNPRIEVLRVSARTGDGLDAWLAWLLDPRRGRASPPTGVGTHAGAAHAAAHARRAAPGSDRAASGGAA